MIGSTTGRYWWLVLALLTSVAYGCGGGSKGTVAPPVDTCANMGTASYVGTEDVNNASGPCPSYSDLSVTFTIVQEAGSCAFTLQSSRISGTTFHGTVSENNVSWTGSYPSASGTVNIDSVSAVLSADLTVLSGSFAWTYAGNTHCTGTTTFHLVKQ
jgi:hypothetical protein